MREKKPRNRARILLYDLSRVKEWWMIAFSLVFFAFVPNIYRIHEVMTMDYILQMLSTPPIYVALIVVFTAQIFLFASNDYFDRQIDALDMKKRHRNPVCNGSVTPQAVRGLLVMTGIIPLALSLYFNFLAFLFTAFSLFVFYFYTAKPLRFKSKIGLDVLSHGVLINTFPYLFCLVALLDFSIGALFLLVALMMRSAIAQILQEVRDYEVDKKVERNTVVALGRKRAVWLTFTLYLILTFTTLTLLVTNQVYDVGISMFYSIVLILCITYIPPFIKLLRTERNYGRIIEKLWVGQGRATFGMSIRYVGSFALYFIILFSFLV